jgi:hypothetical protein
MKWEYTVLECVSSERKNLVVYKWESLDVMARDKQQGSPIPLYEYMNNLGKDGWEVAGFSNNIVILKRPVA